jgi:hypothetical protein
MIASAVTPPFKYWTKLTLTGKSPENGDGAELIDGTEDKEGSEEGWEDGDAVGAVDKVGVKDGTVEGKSEGDTDGVAVGDLVGLPSSIGENVGDVVTGDNVGDDVGAKVEGDPVGELVVGD